MPSALTQAGQGSAPQANDSDLPSRNRSLMVWALIITGAILRLIALGHKSFWLDEIASVAISRRPEAFFWHFLWHDEGNMAAYYVVLKPWLHLGYSEATVRALSVIPGVLSIPLMYLLGARLFGRRAGILSAVLITVNTCAVSVSQEGRAYSFLVLLVLASTYLFVKFIEEPSYSRAVVYALIAGSTCYFHYFGVLVPAAHAVSILALPARRHSWKPLLLAWAIIAAMAAPILWLIHAQDVGHISWLQAPSLLELYHLGVFLAADGGKAIGGILLALELMCVISFVAAFGKAWRDNSDDLLRWRYSLIASVFATPIVITLLVSLVRPAFYHRFLIVCLPGWLVLIAIGLLRIDRRAWRVAAIGAICALSLVTTGLLYRRASEDWRGAVNYLVANTRPEDRVLYYQSVGQFAGESYREWLQPSTPKPTAVGIDPDNPSWQGSLGEARRVWLVLYRAKPDGAATTSVQGELDRRYQLQGEKTFTGVTVFEYNAK
jgi:mannosyltransferase